MRSPAANPLSKNFQEIRASFQPLFFGKSRSCHGSRLHRIKAQGIPFLAEPRPRLKSPSATLEMQPLATPLTAACPFEGYKALGGERHRGYAEAPNPRSRTRWEGRSQILHLENFAQDGGKGRHDLDRRSPLTSHPPQANYPWPSPEKSGYAGRRRMRDRSSIG